MKIKVFFETTNWFVVHAATFNSEATYAACLPALEALAKEQGFDTVTESTTYEEETNEAND
jgi:hypothetical protein